MPKLREAMEAYGIAVPPELYVNGKVNDCFTHDGRPAWYEITECGTGARFKAEGGEQQIWEKEEEQEAPTKKKGRKKKEQLPQPDGPREVKREQIAALMFPQVNDREKPLPTIENLRVLLKHLSIQCSYNILSRKIDYQIPNQHFTIDNEEEASLACLFSAMKEHCLPTDGYLGYLSRIADENSYNPVLDWIRSKPWDGVSRLQDLYDTITSPETEAKELLIRRWLITTVSLALYNGIDAAGCLVLQGKQNIGKTWWVKKLAPDAFVRTGATIDPNNKDSVMQAIRYWIVELGEIGATFRKADIDALKSFLTRDSDVFRKPYAIGASNYVRRTSFVASVDQDIYLHDTAGNRRFWTIPCTSINSYHTINMQQVWAEALDLIENHGENWKMTSDENEHVWRINTGHVQIEPVIEMLKEYLERKKTEICEWKSATKIASDLGIKNITQRETRIITSYLKEFKINRIIDGYRLFSIGDIGSGQ